LEEIFKVFKMVWCLSF